MLGVIVNMLAAVVGGTLGTQALLKKKKSKPATTEES